MKASAISSRTTTPSPGDRKRPLPDRFRLTGPTVTLDPRTHAYRRDIADVDLAGRLFAPHYARAERRQCVAGTMLYGEPNAGAIATSELLHGEPFCLFDCAGGWAWGLTALDGYVGYVPEAVLASGPEPTHRVVARTGLLFAAADIKSPVLDSWPMGSRFAGNNVGEFVETAGGHLHRRHVRPLDEAEADPVAVAERLVGTVYRWGGRSGDGIDCSGLVQLALQLAGHADAPRDSDLQQAALGVPLSADATLRRGDLVFFPGHVGMMVDGERLVHANAHWMAVTIEPLADVIARLASSQPLPVTGRRRIA